MFIHIVIDSGVCTLIMKFIQSFIQNVVAQSVVAMIFPPVRVTFVSKLIIEQNGVSPYFSAELPCIGWCYLRLKLLVSSTLPQAIANRY